MALKLHWIRKSDYVYTTSMLSLAQSKMRNTIIRLLGNWDGDCGASTFVFGGSVRKAIVSEFAIQNNAELQQGLL